jgi:hypothetical protein
MLLSIEQLTAYEQCLESQNLMPNLLRKAQFQAQEQPKSQPQLHTQIRFPLHYNHTHIRPPRIEKPLQIRPMIRSWRIGRQRMLEQKQS